MADPVLRPMPPSDPVKVMERAAQVLGIVSLPRDANKWLITPDGFYCHVRPIADLREHALSKACWCGPTADGSVWVHHAMDRREEYETGRKSS